MSLRNVLKGTGVALVTPFKTNFEIDFNALEKLIDFVIDGGVEYVVTLRHYRRNSNINKRGKKRNN